MPEKWEDLGLSNNFVFQKVMLNEKLCKKILSEILGKEVVKVDYSAYEKTIEIRDDAKGIRLDVYIKDHESTIYNVEIQNSNKGNLPKRSRYYHDLIDLDLIERGAEYENLNHSFVIFICTFDLFEKDYYKYTFVNKCEEVNGLELKDGCTTIFMNTEGHLGGISEDCKAFLKSIKGQFTENEFSAILREEVTRVKENKKWRKEYMFMSVLLRDAEKDAERKGMEKGLQQGLQQGMEQGLQQGMEQGLQQGMEQGLQKGMEQGVQKGIEQGRTEAEKNAIRNMLKKLTIEDVVQLGYEKELVLKISKES